MARGKGEGQITKMADGRFRARVTRDGRTVSATRRTRREAVAELERLRKRLGYTSDTRHTLTTWLEAWMAGMDLAPNSERLYRRMVDDHLVPRLGAYDLTELTTPLVQQTYREMKADGIGTATIGRAHSVLSSALGEAAREGHLEVVPTVHARPPKHTPAKPRPLTPDQARQVLAACRTPGAPSGRILAVILLLGLRVGEAIDLRWHHLDDDGWMTVPGTKTDASAAILPVPQLVADIIGDRGDAQPAWPVFSSSRDRRVPTSRQTVSRDWHRLCDALGIERRRIHDIRHSTGSLLASAGVTTRVVQSVLRHSSAAMSVHYSRPHDEALVEGLDKLTRTLA